jgi:hypothetical protein
MLNMTMRDEWETFAKKVLNRLDEDSLRQAKVVFFAGAYTMFLEMSVASRKYETLEEGAKKIQALEQECMAAFREVPGYGESDGGEAD